MEKSENMISENTLKMYSRCNIQLPQLSRYIEKYYISDIYDCFVHAMGQLKSNYNPLSKNPMCIIIDLDETFLQNDDFYPFTLRIWKHYPALYKFYLHLVKENQFGPILPFMYILYRYCIANDIKVIFISGRLEHLREQTMNNLIFYDVTDFDLYLSDNSIDYKSNIIQVLENNYNILAVLNDQNDSPHNKLIKFPQLYII